MMNLALILVFGGLFGGVKLDGVYMMVSASLELESCFSDVVGSCFDGTSGGLYVLGSISLNRILALHTLIIFALSSLPWMYFYVDKG